MKIAVIQMNSQENKDRNMETALRLIDEAASEGVKLIALPEYVNFLGETSEKLSKAEPIPGPISQAFAEKAKEHGVFIHCGSILEKADQERSYNTSLLLNDAGEIIAVYRKIHLFDMAIEGRVSSNESSTTKPGDQIVTAETPLGTAGLSICYDLRFPEMYRKLALRGAKIMFVPSAFALYTGIHHWEVLLRARAIENQCYVVAAAQIGSFNSGRETNFGSSMVIDPWGTVIARAPEQEVYITADIDLDELERVRGNMPCFAHRRPELYV